MAKGEVTVIAMDQDNVHELGKGKLLLIDNQIDQTTSTIRIKAIVPQRGRAAVARRVRQGARAGRDC